MELRQLGSVCARLEPTCPQFPAATCLPFVHLCVARVEADGNVHDLSVVGAGARAGDVCAVQENPGLSVPDAADAGAARDDESDEIVEREGCPGECGLLDWHVCGAESIDEFVFDCLRGFPLFLFSLSLSL